MKKFNVVVEKTSYEVRSFHDPVKNTVQYEVYNNGVKQFSIYPAPINNSEAIVLWRLTDENKSRMVDYSTVAKLGATIERMDS